MCKKIISSVSELSTLTSFFDSLELTTSGNLKKDLVRLSFEIGNNSLIHGGANEFLISYSEGCIELIDSKATEFNPLTNFAKDARSKGLKYIKDFTEIYPSVIITHDYLSESGSNTITIIIPNEKADRNETHPCRLVLSGAYFSRNDSAILEQLRKLGHCNEIILDFNYGILAYSFVIPLIRDIVDVTKTRKPNIIIRVDGNDRVKSVIQDEVKRLVYTAPDDYSRFTVQ
jgi:hypothetical protein